MSQDLTFFPEAGGPRFPLLKFSFAISGELVLAVGLFYLIAPTRFWYELAFGKWILAGLVFIQFFLSAFEYYYHRYLLHHAVLPFMAAQHRAHNTHHGLTKVTAPIDKDMPDFMAPVTSKYAVEEKEQEESMMFPLWSLPIFYAVFLIIFGGFFALINLSFPVAGHFPIVFSVILASTFHYCGYELWHAALHLPYEKFWKPRLYGHWYSKTLRRVYVFHVMHHFATGCNEAVVGFMGFALWDHAYRTHRRPMQMPLPGGKISYAEAQLPVPRWPISMLDAWRKPMYQGSRKIEKQGWNLLVATGRFFARLWPWKRQAV